MSMITPPIAPIGYPSRESGYQDENRHSATPPDRAVPGGAGQWKVTVKPEQSGQSRMTWLPGTVSFFDQV